MLDYLLASLGLLPRGRLRPVGYQTTNWINSKNGLIVGHATFLFFLTSSGRRFCRMEGRNPKNTTYYAECVLPWLNGMISDRDAYFEPLSAEEPRKASVLSLVKS